jgi:hypothetical protein
LTQPKEVIAVKKLMTLLLVSVALASAFAKAKWGLGFFQG